MSLDFSSSNSSQPLNQSLSSVIDAQISKMLAVDTTKWSISLHVIGGGLDYYNWSKSNINLLPRDFDTMIKELSDRKDNLKSMIVNAVPQGTIIQEIVTDSPGHYDLQALTTVPRKKILFIISLDGDNLEKAKLQIPNIVSNLYWTIIQAGSVN
jgi:hypothetical protein